MTVRAERAAFAGVEASIGIIVFGLFWILGLLGTLGFAALLVTGQVARTAEALGGFAILAAAFALWSYFILRDLRNVRVVDIEADGTWLLRGPFGIPRGRIAAGAPREVHGRQREVWRMMGTIKKSTEAWAEISAGDRQWRTTRSIPEVQRKALAVLERHR
jgi:hypothetical protein